MMQPVDHFAVHQESILRTLVPSELPSKNPLLLKKEWEQAILQYDKCGGVVEMAFLRPLGQGSPDAEHRHAATTTMKLLAARKAYYFDTLAKLEGKKPRIISSTLLDGKELEGSEISIEAFLGSGYDLSKRSFTMPPMSPIPGKVEDLANLPEGKRGLVYAACTAPHRVADYEKHFTWLVGDVFDWFRQPIEVYRWNTDCSSYFDDGKEWWGAFFWTVHLKPQDLLVGLVASTTD